MNNAEDTCWVPLKKGKECPNIKYMASVGYGLFKHSGVTFQASVQLYDVFRSSVPTHKNVSDERFYKLCMNFNCPWRGNVGHLIL